jgi:hypothetical protein
MSDRFKRVNREARIQGMHRIHCLLYFTDNLIWVTSYLRFLPLSIWELQTTQILKRCPFLYSLH